MSSPGAGVVRFGVFEADLAAGELRKQGRLVKLQQQPFDVLRVLVEQPGQVVTREALHKRLWSDGVTVDFDQSLNKAVTKLRDALGDTAESPRFIETLPKRGYRFIAAVEMMPAASDATPVPPAPSSPAVAAVPATSLPVAAHAHPHEPASLHVPPTPPAPEARRVARLTPLQWLPLLGLAAVLAALASATARAPRDEPATAAPAPSAVPAMSTNPSAVDAYERGRIAAAHRTAESLRAGVANFERALAADARFAAAYVALADAHSVMASDGLEDPKTAMPRAREAANRALTLDPGLAPAHASLGRTTMLFDWDWKIALWHFERARDLAPNHAIGRQWFAACYAAMAMPVEAEKEARSALALQPLDVAANTTLGHVLYMAKRYPDAEAQLRRTLELDPGFVQARRLLGLTLVLAAKPSDAVIELERAAQLAGETPTSLADLAMARAKAGDTAGARRLLTRLIGHPEPTAFVAPDGIAQVYWGLGDEDSAVQWLQKAYDARVSTVAYLMADPLWDDLRDDPRVGAMIEGIKNGKAPAAPLP